MDYGGEKLGHFEVEIGLCTAVCTVHVQVTPRALGIDR